jgi:copper chaperone CopZ
VSRWLLLAGGVLAFLGTHPASAAPTVRATVSHLCCGACANAVKGGVSGVAWIESVTAEPASKSVTVTAKAGMPIDVAALTAALSKTGFPPQVVVLTGARALDVNVGHLCCGGCVGPLKAALDGVTWIAAADVKPNSPVRLTLKEGAEIRLNELVDAMAKAGYSANGIAVVAP